MATLDKETIKKLTGLCRIDCTEDEQLALMHDLQKIIGYMDLLQEIDTENVKPCNHVLESIVNVTRPDIVGQTLDRDLVLRNAPSQIAGLFRFPLVIKQN